MDKLPIRKILDLSTAHLQEDTCQDLNGYPGIIAHETGYGWLMYLNGHEPDDELAERVEDDDWPAELLPIFRLGRANDCTYVLFDRDAETIAELPSFDW